MPCRGNYLSFGWVGEDFISRCYLHGMVWYGTVWFGMVWYVSRCYLLEALIGSLLRCTCVLVLGAGGRLSQVQVAGSHRLTLFIYVLI